jgi:Flp pilus assembly protein TadD
MGNMMAERFCYFPSFPFVGLALLAGFDLVRRGGKGTRRIGTAVLAAWMIFAAAATIARNQDWRDERTFLETTLAQSPKAALLWTNLANDHLRHRRLDEAAEALARARELAPSDYSVNAAQATWYVVAGRPADAVPIQEQIAKLAFRSRPVALSNLAYLYRITGRHREALTILKELIDEGWGYAAVYYNLAEVYLARHELDAARTAFQQALAQNPRDLHSAVGLARLETMAGNLEEAERHYRNALALYPDDTRLYNNLAMIREQRGDRQGAMQLLATAVALEPTTTAPVVVSTVISVVAKMPLLDVLALIVSVPSVGPEV